MEIEHLLRQQNSNHFFQFLWRCNSGCRYDHIPNFSLFHSRSTMFWKWSGPNLDLTCVQQSDTASFCENYAKLYFGEKHLEKGLNRGWWNFWCPFSLKELPLLANIGCCRNFLDLTLMIQIIYVILRAHEVT